MSARESVRERTEFSEREGEFLKEGERDTLRSSEREREEAAASCTCHAREEKRKETSWRERKVNKEMIINIYRKLK